MFNWWLSLHNKYGVPHPRNPRVLENPWDPTMGVPRSFPTLVLFKINRSNPSNFCWLTRWKRVLNLRFSMNEMSKVEKNLTHTMANKIRGKKTYHYKSNIQINWRAYFYTKNNNKQITCKTYFMFLCFVYCINGIQ